MATGQCYGPWTLDMDIISMTIKHAKRVWMRRREHRHHDRHLVHHLDQHHLHGHIHEHHYLHDHDHDHQEGVAGLHRGGESVIVVIFM